MEPLIRISEALFILSSELHFITSRSSGPGGQNVNKVESRVTLHFDLECSTSLSESQKERVRRELSTRISKAGILRIVSQKHRTQGANRKVAVERFSGLLAKALKPAVVRKLTRRSRAIEARRLEEKRRRGRLKRDRTLARGADD